MPATSLAPTTTRLLLYGGVLVPVLFWAATLVAARWYGPYDHFRNTVSQLGAVGAPSEPLMTLCTWGCVVVSLGLLVGVWRACGELALSRLPLVGIVGFGVMFGWAATFHAGHPLHAAAGPVLLLVLLGPLLTVVLWKGPEFKTLRLLSGISFVLMLLILLRALPSEVIRNNYTGLIQRFVHVGWSTWFIALAVGLNRVLDTHRTPLASGQG